LTLRFGRDVCGDLAVAERREWLVTNGMGGYASGTVAGLLARRYHGLLVAATQAPVGRTLLVPKFDETVTYLGRRFALGANRWADGTIDPTGYLNIESFHLDGSAPVWRFACGDAIVEKRLWMPHGCNATMVRYTVERGTSDVQLDVKAFVDGRDHHGTTRATDRPIDVTQTPSGFRFAGGAVACVGMGWTLDGAWYYGFDLARERERGLEAIDDHACAAHGSIVLAPGASCTIELRSGEDGGDAGDGSWERFAERERTLLRAWRASARTQAVPARIERLVTAADQFVVDAAPRTTAIAGYPWFTDWGRDTMISLPGLLLVTGRPDTARSILETFGRYVDRGMIPNRFPDAGGAPEYNTVDATLWYVLAVSDYVTTTGDAAFARQTFSVLEEIVDWHVRGTRFGIRVDPADGLLTAGAPGVQLTWMDAKVGDWVVTPRAGKAVEINALWFNALVAVAEIAQGLGAQRAGYDTLAARARSSFARFWDAGANRCVDVIDGPSGTDASLRPNQIFAVSLPVSPLTPAQMRAVVDACARDLLTSFGLRSLAPSDAAYCGNYEGDPASRDRAYHQGTVWGWVLGPFALAHYRAYGDAGRALAFLEPLADAIDAYGVGTLGEIFDGDPPHLPRGCIAQAWTVAETLRAWTILDKELHG
jgi:predicted glycogen debranching enzyme